MQSSNRTRATMAIFIWADSVGEGSRDLAASHLERHRDSKEAYERRLDALRAAGGKEDALRAAEKEMKTMGTEEACLAAHYGGGATTVRAADADFERIDTPRPSIATIRRCWPPWQKGGGKTLSSATAGNGRTHLRMSEMIAAPAGGSRKQRAPGVATLVEPAVRREGFAERGE